MVIVNAPLKSDVFRRLAEESGLKFVKKVGIKMVFENPNGNDEAVAAALKKKCKGTKEVSALAFQVTTG